MKFSGSSDQPARDVTHNTDQVVIQCQNELSNTAHLMVCKEYEVPQVAGLDHIAFAREARF